MWEPRSLSGSWKEVFTCCRRRIDNNIPLQFFARAVLTLFPSRIIQSKEIRASWIVHKMSRWSITLMSSCWSSSTSKKWHLYWRPLSDTLLRMVRDKPYEFQGSFISELFSRDLVIRDILGYFPKVKDKRLYLAFSTTSLSSGGNIFHTKAYCACWRRWNAWPGSTK